MKIVNVKKFIKTNLIIMGLIIAICVISSNITLSHGEVIQKTVIVSDGDTLWSIAKYEQANNQYYMEYDIRDIVYQIKKLNNIDNDLQIGQKLLLNEM